MLPLVLQSDLVSLPGALARAPSFLEGSPIEAEVRRRASRYFYSNTLRTEGKRHKSVIMTSQLHGSSNKAEDS